MELEQFGYGERGRKWTGNRGGSWTRNDYSDE
jgi:hypothetical protein